MDQDRPQDRIGIIGAGAMGKGLLYQSTLTPGVRCAAIGDARIDRCVAAAEAFQLDYAIADNENELADLVNQGRLAICEDGLWLSRCEPLAAVIEATSAIGPAGLHAMTALESGKHLILMNSEVDLSFGPLLADTARRNQVICTSCDGDQYGVLKHLIDDIRRWGLDLVMAGNLKGYLDRYADPVSIIPEADKRNLDHRMCASYTDGTKLNIEMAIIANACGLSTKITGMYGHRAQQVAEALQLFDLDALWKDREPFVDYLLGAEPGGGVFAIGHCDHPYQQAMLAYYKMGTGPYYVLYRPYHLCHIEALGTVLEVLGERKSFLTPVHGFQTNVFAYAKTDLASGAELDGVGGHACYGLIENCRNDGVSGLPICLAEGVTLRKAVARDARIGFDDILYDPGRSDFALYARALGCSAAARREDASPRC